MRRGNLLEIRKMIVLKHLKPPCERYRVLPARLKAPYGWRLRSIQWTGSSFPLEWGSPENNHKIRCLRGAIPGTHDHFDAARATALVWFHSTGRRRDARIGALRTLSFVRLCGTPDVNPGRKRSESLRVSS